MSVSAEPQAQSAPTAAELDHCRRCDLWREATRGVPGEGPAGAALMLVGEQPGDQEDRVGRPFVGPAGRLLDELLTEAGLSRERSYVTNAVKHFKWTPRGKRRLHVRPNVGEIVACGLWLEQEIASQRPSVIVLLGATAVRAVIGRSEPIDKLRGQRLQAHSGAELIVTYHPSAVLRADERAQQLRGLLVADLRSAARRLEEIR
jgi:uracil-DNA glycosylase